MSTPKFRYVFRNSFCLDYALPTIKTMAAAYFKNGATLRYPTKDTVIVELKKAVTDEELGGYEHDLNGWLRYNFADVRISFA